MADASKVQFGLSKAYYAPINVSAGGVESYGTPVALPGAVSLTLNREGSDPEKFWADNIAYYVSPAVNGGYTGTLTLAKVPNHFKTAILGEIVDDNGIQLEVSDANSKEFALMYEVDGDADEKRYAFYKCTAQRIAESANTKSDSTTPDTQDLEFTAIGKDFTFGTGANAFTKNIVKGSASTSETAFSSWYTAVPVPVITESGATGDTE
jgi:phi13 family phage major tail protein